MNAELKRNASGTRALWVIALSLAIIAISLVTLVLQMQFQPAVSEVPPPLRSVARTPSPKPNIPAAAKRLEGPSSIVARASAPGPETKPMTVLERDNPDDMLILDPPGAAGTRKPVGGALAPATGNLPINPAKIGRAHV